MSVALLSNICLAIVSLLSQDVSFRRICLFNISAFKTLPEKTDAPAVSFDLRVGINSGDVIILVFLLLLPLCSYCLVLERHGVVITRP
jgi:hypothetical protein